MTLLELGRIGKAHGLKGEVTATLSTDRPERAAPGAIWHLDDGPVTVRAIKAFQQRWIVQLDGVVTREGADALRGQIVRGEPIEDPGALWVHDLVGAEVRTADGRSWGDVVSVLANPADDLLELDDGTLIPVGFVTDTSAMPEVVEVTVPDGLLGTDEP